MQAVFRLKRVVTTNQHINFDITNDSKHIISGSQVYFFPCDASECKDGKIFVYSLDTGVQVNCMPTHIG